MMQGIWFGEKHSYRDFGLITNEIKVGLPTVKTKYVSVAGGNGSLDLSEAFGGVKYDNRTLSFVFTAIGENRKRVITNYMHGRRLRIVLDSDPFYCYIGRCQINEIKTNKRLLNVTINAECEPFRYHVSETAHKERVEGTNTFICINDTMPVIPTMELNADMKITFKGVTYHLTAGTHKLLDIQLEEGYNRFTAEGNGMITFRYQEGAL